MKPYYKDHSCENDKGQLILIHVVLRYGAHCHVCVYNVPWPVSGNPFSLAILRVRLVFSQVSLLIVIMIEDQDLKATGWGKRVMKHEKSVPPSPDVMRLNSMRRSLGIGHLIRQRQIDITSPGLATLHPTNGHFISIKQG